MNINEECLLNFLKKPDELSYTTDVLKINNHILEQAFVRKVFLAKTFNLNYTYEKSE